MNSSSELSIRFILLPVALIYRQGANWSLDGVNTNLTVSWDSKAIC